jgi:hypothetical protein
MAFGGSALYRIWPQLFPHWGATHRQISTVVALHEHAYGVATVASFQPA